MRKFNSGSITLNNEHDNPSTRCQIINWLYEDWVRVHSREYFYHFSIEEWKTSLKIKIPFRDMTLLQHWIWTKIINNEKSFSYYLYCANGGYIFNKILLRKMKWNNAVLAKYAQNVRITMRQKEIKQHLKKTKCVQCCCKVVLTIQVASRVQ